MQCLTPDKLTGVFKHVVGVCESIFVVELSGCSGVGLEIYWKLEYVVGMLVKIGTNGVLCLWLSCKWIQADKAEC
jgi:hypothetical protein